jgi:hypothetical protein
MMIRERQRNASKIEGRGKYVNPLGAVPVRIVID